MTVVLTGPAGAGKTTVGRQLAHDLGWPFLDADSLHSTDAVEQIRSGQSLSDADREPWLGRVVDAVRTLHDTSPQVVVACSALKRRYRDRLADGVLDVRREALQAAEMLVPGGMGER